MKPAASPARSSPGAAGSGGLDGERAEADWPRDHSGPSETLGQLRVGAKRLAQQPGRCAERRAIGGDDAGVGHSARQRRDADVAPVSQMHLAKAAGALDEGDVVKVRPDGPSSRTPRVPREAAGTGEAGSGAVRGNHQRRAQHRGARSSDCHSGHDSALDCGRLNEDALVDGGARRASGGQERVIERVPRDHATLPAAAVSTLQACPGLARHDHSIHRQSAIDGVREAQTSQQIERARVHGVATELETRKPRPIEHAHSRPGARQDQRRNSAGRTGANDDDIVLGHYSWLAARC